MSPSIPQSYGLFLFYPVVVENLVESMITVILLIFKEI